MHAICHCRAAVRREMENYVMYFRFALITCAVIGFHARARADTLPELDLGLWQWTTTLTTVPTVPPARLAGMSPANRAIVEAHLHDAAVPQSYTSCLTEEKLRKGFNISNRIRHPCEHQIIVSSPTRYEEQNTCHNPILGQIGMHITMAVVNRRSITGTLEVTHASATALISNLSGTWMKASCGDVE
jgi:hypothetical protein